MFATGNFAAVFWEGKNEDETIPYSLLL